MLSAASAAGALRICQELDRPPDLILTDVVMPGLSGPELVEAVRVLRPGIPALFMSGYPGDFLSADSPSQAEGTTLEIIGKPFTATTLLEGVRGALRRASGEPRPPG